MFYVREINVLQYFTNKYLFTIVPYTRRQRYDTLLHLVQWRKCGYLLALSPLMYQL